MTFKTSINFEFSLRASVAHFLIVTTLFFLNEITVFYPPSLPHTLYLALRSGISNLFLQVKTRRQDTDHSKGVTEDLKTIGNLHDP